MVKRRGRTNKKASLLRLWAGLGLDRFELFNFILAYQVTPADLLTELTALTPSAYHARFKVEKWGDLLWG